MTPIQIGVNWPFSCRCIASCLSLTPLFTLGAWTEKRGTLATLLRLLTMATLGRGHQCVHEGHDGGREGTLSFFFTETRNVWSFSPSVKQGDTVLWNIRSKHSPTLKESLMDALSRFNQRNCLEIERAKTLSISGFVSL